MKRAVLCFLLLLAACSRDTNTSAQSAQDESSGARRITCTEFALIGRGEDACGVALTQTSNITLDDAPMQGGAPLIVTSGVDRRVESLMIYPTPLGRFVYVRGCEGPPPAPGLCWRSIILDRDSGEARDLTPRSHYGPSRDIFWSPDGARFALIEPMEGYEALTIVNPETAAIRSYPPEGGVNNWRVDEASLRWTSNTQLSARVEICNGDTGQCTAPQQQTLSME